MLSPQHILATLLAFACVIWPMSPVRSQTTPLATQPSVGVVLCVAGLALREGGTYTLYDGGGPVSIRVDKPRVTFLRGTKPIWAATGRPVFDLVAGGCMVMPDARPDRVRRRCHEVAAGVSRSVQDLSRQPPA